MCLGERINLYNILKCEALERKGRLDIVLVFGPVLKNVIVGNILRDQFRGSGHSTMFIDYNIDVHTFT